MSRGATLVALWVVYVVPLLCGGIVKVVVFHDDRFVGAAPMLHGAP